jgi:hypothetical protein
MPRSNPPPELRRSQVAPAAQTPPTPRFEGGYTVEPVWGEVVGVVATVAHARADLAAPGTI